VHNVEGQSHPEHVEDGDEAGQPACTAPAADHAAEEPDAAAGTGTRPTREECRRHESGG